MTWVLADAACIAELEKIEKDKGEETTLGEIATEFTMERADADVTNLDLYIPVAKNRRRMWMSRRQERTTTQTKIN